MKEENKITKKKVNRKKIIIYIALVLILIYLAYAVYLLVRQPTDKVTGSNEGIWY